VSIRLGLVVGLLVAIAVTYLASINPGRTHLALGGDWALDVPLMALVVGAVGVGAALALLRVYGAHAANAALAASGIAGFHVAESDGQDKDGRESFVHEAHSTT